VSATPLRVRLRPPHPDEANAVQSWLAEAYGAIDGTRPPAGSVLALPEFEASARRRWPGSECLTVDLDGVPVGFVVAHRKREGDGAETAILALAVRADHRNVGYGGEAVQAMEAMRPADRFTAAIPRANGLAVYFWLRTGYRPITVDEDRHRARDPNHLWMVRGGPWFA
jgi:predicted acetyltransferase